MFKITRTNLFYPLLLLALVLVVGCGESMSNSNGSGANSSIPGGKSDSMSDSWCKGGKCGVCAKKGWYNNGKCHTECVDRDPDCFEPLESDKIRCHSGSLEPYQMFDIKDDGEDAKTPLVQDKVKDATIQVGANISVTSNYALPIWKEPKTYEDACELNDEGTKLQCDLGTAAHATVPLTKSGDKWCEDYRSGSGHFVRKGTVDAGVLHGDSDVICYLNSEQDVWMLKKCEPQSKFEDPTLEEWLRGVAPTVGAGVLNDRFVSGARVTNQKFEKLPTEIRKDAKAEKEYVVSELTPKGSGEITGSFRIFERKFPKYDVYGVTIQYEEYTASDGKDTFHGIVRYYDKEGKPVVGYRWDHGDKFDFDGKFVDIESARD